MICGIADCSTPMVSCPTLGSVMVPAERATPLSKEELETARTLIKRMLVETDREQIRAFIEQLRHIVGDEPPVTRPN